MKLFLRIALILMIALGCVGAMACDSRQPRCKAINELLDGLKYLEAISEIQMKCRGATVALSPDNIKQNKPAMLMGVIPDGKARPLLDKVYDAYIDEACGSVELVYWILEGYRKAWDRRIAGGDVNDVVKRVKAGGREAVAEDAAFVSAEVNEEVMPILASMEQIAMSNYSARIMGIVTGEAVTIVGGSSCSAPPPETTLIPPSN